MTTHGMSRLLVALVGLGIVMAAQQPPNCAVGGFTISPDGTAWVCKGAGTPPEQIQMGGGSAVPQGAILLIASGACPAGYAEETTLDGKTLIGTLAANANIGTTGGADTITPTVSDHASHTHTYTDVIAHTHTIPVGATDDTSAPFDRADAGTNTGGANATTASGSTGVATGTTAGPNATLTHVGQQFDNRSAFARVIFCRKT